MKLNMDRVLEAAQADQNLGFCISCGAEHPGIEPDGRQGECEACGTRAVYGAEEILIMGYVRLTKAAQQV